MKYAVDYTEIRQHAEGYWFEILEELAPGLIPAIEAHPNHVPCPVHGGVDGFRLFDDAEETGGGICNTCGGFSNGFKILSWINNWTTWDSFYQVGLYLGWINEDEDY